MLWEMSHVRVLAYLDKSGGPAGQGCLDWTSAGGCSYPVRQRKFARAAATPCQTGWEKSFVPLVLEAGHHLSLWCGQGGILLRLREPVPGPSPNCWGMWTASVFQRV